MLLTIKNDTIIVAPIGGLPMPKWSGDSTIYKQRTQHTRPTVGRWSKYTLFDHGGWYTIERLNPGCLSYRLIGVYSDLAIATTRHQQLVKAPANTCLPS
jgi:hypothetical protein